MASEAAPVEDLDEERRLVEEAQRGNLDAMRPIFDRYASPLYATVILPRAGDVAAAEDVLRDTLMTAVEKLDQFTWQGRSIYPWLRQIAVNKVYDLHRKAKRSQKLVQAMAAEVPVETPAEDLPDAVLIAEEDRKANRARIVAAMEQLSERYRRAIQLRLLDELPREECARLMDVTIGNFDVLFFRAVRAFRKHFGERAD